MSKEIQKQETTVTIKCPHCGKEVEVTRSVVHDKVVKVGICDHCKEEIHIEREV